MRKSKSKYLAPLSIFGFLIFGCAGRALTESQRAISSENSTEVYVATNGSDENPGTQDKPFKTIEKAKATVRKINKNPNEDIHVWLRGGDYFLASALIFDPEDSGSQNKIIYSAFPGEVANISSAKKIKGWMAVSENPRIFKASIGGARFQQLFIGSEMGTRAQYPKDTGKVYPVIQQAQVGKFRVDAAVIKKALKGATGKILGNLQIVMPQHWDTSKLTIQRVDYTSNGSSAWLTLDAVQGMMEWCAQNPTLPSCTYKIDQAGAKYIQGKKLAQPFFLQNNSGFVTEPGEWFLDPETQTVYLYPPKQIQSVEDLEKTGVTVPFTPQGADQNLIQLKGTPEKPVSGICFQNLQFSFSDWNDSEYRGHVASIGAGMQRDFKTETSDKKSGMTSKIVPAAIFLTYVKDILIDQNLFSAIGGIAIHGGAGTQGLMVSHNTFLNTGSTGIYVEEFSGNPAHANESITITNNTFKKIGVGGFAASAMYLMGRKITVTYNAIEHVSNSGIMITNACQFDASEMYRDISVVGNAISFTNEIQGDGAALYSCGNQPGLVFTGNVVKGVHFPSWMQPDVPKWGFGLYLDWGNIGVKAENNIFSDVPKVFNLNCEGGNLIQNNRIPPVIDQLVTKNTCPGKTFPPTVLKNNVP